MIGIEVVRTLQRWIKKRSLEILKSLSRGYREGLNTPKSEGYSNKAEDLRALRSLEDKAVGEGD